MDSIINQSVLFDEVILINDGSIDNSLEICKHYVSCFEYFKLIDQKNAGLSRARNIGISYALSDYIMFLDSDDYLKQDTVKILKEQLKKNQYDALFFDADVHFEKNLMEKKNAYDRSNANLDGTVMSGWNYFTKCYPQNYVVSACMAIYKTEILLKSKIKFPERLYYEDNYFMFVFLNHAQKVIHISEKLYQRRFRESSITTSGYSERKIQDQIKIGLLIWDEISCSRQYFLQERKGLLIRFISDYIWMIIEKRELCLKQGIGLRTDTKSLLSNMALQYSILLTALSVYELKEIPLLNKILGGIDKILLWDIENSKELKIIAKKIADRQKKLYSYILNDLPLNEKDKKIAIYGMGKHTEGLFAVYEKLIGKISCDLIFIDSYTNNEEYRGKKIIRYQEIDRSFQLIIISSFLYKQEMLDNIRRVDEKLPTYIFYDELKEDIFFLHEIFLKYC